MKAAESNGGSYFMPPEVTYDWVKRIQLKSADLVQRGPSETGTRRSLSRWDWKKSWNFQDAGGNRL